MSALREWAASLGEAAHKAVAVSSLGKLKTTSQVILSESAVGLQEWGLPLPLLIAYAAMTLTHLWRLAWLWP